MDINSFLNKLDESRWDSGRPTEVYSNDDYYKNSLVSNYKLMKKQHTDMDEDYWVQRAVFTAKMALKDTEYSVVGDAQLKYDIKKFLNL